MLSTLQESKTKILISRSLADLYGERSTRDATGATVSQWSTGGAFFQFSGTRESSNRTDTLLAAINGDAARGSTRIPVSMCCHCELPL